MVAGDAPFRHWIIDGWCEPLPYAALAGVAWEASYANDVERGKRTARDVRGSAAAAVAHRLADARSADHWARLLGEPLRPDPTNHGGGLHVMAAGGWLQGHLDYAAHPRLPGLERRLNVIAFLHPEWRREWGGQLLLLTPGGLAAAEIEPAPGRLVAFETGDVSYHGVRVLSPAAPPRVSAAAYYLAPLRPGVTRERAVFFPNRSEAGRPPAEVS